MKTIILNECGGYGVGFGGCGGGGGASIIGFGCSPDLSPRTLRAIYGSKDTVKRKMKKRVETTKQAFNQDQARFIWEELTRAQWNVEFAIGAYAKLINEINKKIAKLKDKEKIKVGKRAIAEMEKRIPVLQKIYNAMKKIESAEIAIPYENGNKVFVI